MSYWICHWRNRYWKHEINPEGKRLSSSGSNMLSKRNVKAKDIVYVVSILDGILLLGGRMIVTEIVSRAELVRRRQDDGFYDAAEWAIAEPPGTRLDLHAPSTRSRSYCEAEIHFARVPAQTSLFP